jgi:transposase InsO family protein
MREHGLHAKRRRKYIPTTNSNHGLAVCKNILDRQFYAEKPGEKRVSDITYLRTSGAWVYLTVVLDLYDRKVVGRALSGDMESEHTVIPALAMAAGNRTASPRPAVSFRPRRTVLLKKFSGTAAAPVSGRPAEHEPEGQLPGQRLRREFFQNPQGGAGNA